jgi:CubicO group peptidase (beta-lactamase class C family)
MLGLTLCAIALGLCAPLAHGADTTSAATPDFAAIDAHIEQQMHKLRIPGLALGIVQGDQVIHLKGFGMAGPDKRAITPQTPFQIGSLGKPMTGVAIMQLVEAGKLELDAPVQRYLPWFRVADAAASAQITPRHLLYHTSGLPIRAGMEQAFRADERPEALEERVRGLRLVELNRPVGASYEYSNAGYMVLGMLIQEVSGQPFEQYMADHVFGPLQMRQTFTDWTEARAHGAASGHRFWFGIPVAGDLAVNRGNLPAGAHTSASAEDVSHFLIAQLNGGRFDTTALLSPAGITAMQRPVVPDAAGAQVHAMGWDATAVGGVTALVKDGATADFLAYMFLIPERRLGVVVLMNANQLLSVGELTAVAYNTVELLVGQRPTSIPANPIVTLLYTVALIAVVLQAAGMARTVALLRRWRERPELRPQGWAGRGLRLGLPLLSNIAWGMVALVGVPALLRLPFAFGLYMAPDLFSLLLVSGVIALTWAIVRTALLWRLVRAPSVASAATAIA